MSTDITRRAHGDYDEGLVKVIRDTVAKDCTEPEFRMFLEVSAKYALDPLAGQIYAAKVGGRNGGPGRMALIVARDGFQIIAERNEDYIGMDCDVVHANDEYEKTILSEGPRVMHKVGKPAERGPIVGAWCIVHRLRRRPTYFFAPWVEYNAPTKDTWKKYPSAMILKVAQSVALRQGFSITGVVGEEEMDATRFGTDVVDTDINWGEDEVLAVRTRELLDLANTIVPNSYRDGKVRMRLARADEASRREFLHELEGFIEANDGEVPEEAVEGSVAS